MRLVVLVALLLCGVAIASNQFPFDVTLPIASNGTQIWQHPSSENHYIEVRACNLCVGQDLWSGYFHSIPDKISIFFVFARASINPESAPLALWTNGGPGTSSLSVAFSRATGCILEEDYRGMRLTHKPDPQVKPWNDKMNVVFIEQPVGTGFSRGNGKGEEDTRVGAEYIYEFIQVVLARHPHISDVSLHSLSYGGHFIPEWAKRIVDENVKVKGGNSNNHVIPLKSMTMGNAWFGTDEEYLARLDSICDSHPYPTDSIPLLGPTECKRISVHRSICADFLKRCREHPSDNCAAAHLWCLTSIYFFNEQTGRNPYHISDFATTPEGYNTYSTLSRYLNLRLVQVALGAIGREDPCPRKWEFHNSRVSVLHTLAGDHVRRTDVLLPAIIDAGVNILIYEGILDYMCSVQGVRAVIEMQGLVEGEISRNLEEWKHGPGRYVCSAKPKRTNAGRFCYLEIYGQGHSVAIEYDGWPNIMEKWNLEGSI
jgi:cathepsin A (carboxypeptidase C)